MNPYISYTKRELMETTDYKMLAEGPFPTSGIFEDKFLVIIV